LSLSLIRGSHPS